MKTLMMLGLLATATLSLNGCNRSNPTQLSLGGGSPDPKKQVEENKPSQAATAEMNQVLIDLFGTIETSEPLRMIPVPIGGLGPEELLWLQKNSPKPATGETPPAILSKGPRDLFTPEDVASMTAQIKANQNIRFDSSKIGFLASEGEGIAYSVPLFSADHKRALLSMCVVKGGQSLYGESYLYEKVNGRWTEVLRFGEYEI